MFGRMGRAWRRIAVGTLLFSILLWVTWHAGVLPDAPSLDEVQTPTDIAAFAIAIVIVAFGCVAVVVWTLAVLMPGLLASVDLLLLTLLLGLPLATLLSDANLPGLAIWVVYMAIFFALDRMIYGTWLSEILPRNSKTKVTAFEIAEPLGDVWARLAPLPENAGRYYWPNAGFRDPPPGSDADFVMQAPRRWGLKDVQDEIWIEDLDPGRSVTLRSRPMSKGTAVSERLQLRLWEVGDKTRVELQITFLRPSIFQRFRIWLSNDVEDFFASQKNRALGRRDGTVHGRQMRPA
ncbi:MAG: hypothetical protein AAGO57_05525 [Pseudomonadota bacterium]